MISVRPTGRVFEYGKKKINVTIFSDIINMISAKLCMMEVLIELYPFIPLSVTLIVLDSRHCTLNIVWLLHTFRRLCTV